MYHAGDATGYDCNFTSLGIEKKKKLCLPGFLGQPILKLVPGKLSGESEGSQQDIDHITHWMLMDL